MAPKALVRTTLLALTLGLAACGRKKETAPEPGVDLTAIRARRDSLRQVALQDSVSRAKFATCSDSVSAKLAKATKGKKKPAPVPEGMIPPEVLTACGKPPLPKVAQVAQAPAPKSDSAAHLVSVKVDSGAKNTQAKLDSAAKGIKGKADWPAGGTRGQTIYARSQNAGQKLTVVCRIALNEMPVSPFVIHV